MILSTLLNVFKLKQEGKNPTCGRCKTEIKVPDYVLVSAVVVKNSKTPVIFAGPEHAFNYAQQIPMHPTCWMDTLRDHGIPLYDMSKVYEKIAEENKKKKEEEKDHGVGQNDTSRR